MSDGCRGARRSSTEFVLTAGAAVAHRTYPGQFHGLITMENLLPKARDALRDIGVWLRAAT